MAYMYVIAECCSCHRTISFNPDFVPSIRINGIKEPLCLECFKTWQQIHNKVIPLHPGAYEPQEVA